MAERDALLRRTFALARAARDAGDHPFGALLVVDGAIVAEAHNRVNSSHDITAHAETMLVRVLEQRDQLGLLSAGTVYASCEPCPMCVGAMFWAGARHVVFGLSAATLTELATAPGNAPMGFEITAPEIGRRATPPMHIEGPLHEAEAAQVHDGYWSTRT
jgi:tRNA(Arg) A34 adenosine deaminase TadA